MILKRSGGLVFQIIRDPNLNVDLQVLGFLNRSALIVVLVAELILQNFLVWSVKSMDRTDIEAANEGLAISKMNKYRLKQSNVKLRETYVSKPNHPRPMPDFLKGFLLEKIKR